jgi:thiol-disulfide isomerase/thioredoxin
MRRMIAAGPSAKRPPHRAFGPAAPGPAGSRSAGSDPGGSGRLFASFGTVAVALLLAVGAALAAEPDLKPGEFIAASPPQPAPELSFQDLSGNWVALADFKGKLVLLNLWATWCQPCLKEMPSLEKLQGSREDKLTVAAVSEDRGGKNVVEPFIAKLGLDKVKPYLDPKSAVGHAFSVRGLPTTLIIDSGGKVVGRVEGAAEWDSDKMATVLQPFLPEVSEDAKLKRAER